MSSVARSADMKDDRVPRCLHWSKEDVADWVEKLGFPHYRECFLSNMINGRKLIMVDASAMPRIGVTDFKHIQIISKGIRDLLEIEDPNWHRSISLPPREALGMYIEMKSRTGTETADLTFNKFLMTNEAIKWQPPLSNHCMILPHD